MKTNLKVKKVISCEEVEAAKKLYLKAQNLKEQLAEIKKLFAVVEEEFFEKYDSGAGIEPGSPMFIIKEYSRKVIAWQKEMEKVCGKEVVDVIKENIVPTIYRNLEF